MIKSALLKTYRIKEFLQFIGNVLMIVNQHHPDKLKLKTLCHALSLPYEKLQESYKQNPVGDITPQLASLDERRDRAVICLHKVSKGYAHHEDEKKVAASKLITACMAKYGSKLYQLNYSAETATLKNLIRDLQTNAACMAALQELHLAEVVEVMHQANTEFEALFVQRLEQAGQQDNSKELMQLVANAYRTLVQHIEAHATLNPSQGYTLLIKHMNQNISHFNKVATRRRTVSTGGAVPADTATVDTAALEETQAVADAQTNAPAV